VAEKPTEQWVEKFELIMIGNADDAKAHMPKGKSAFIGDWDERFADWGKFTVNPDFVLNSLHYDRAWKTEYEIECMRRANRRGARGHVAAERAFREGASEFEIHLAYLRASDHPDEELPYGNIIALNEHGATLHYYHHGRERIDEEQRFSFLIDAGASYNGYASDITRTYSQRQDMFQQLIAAMNEMQLLLVESVKPGVNYPDIHLSAHRAVAEILRHFDFVHLDDEAIFDRGITSTFLPHGVGHYIGLQVHDVGGFMADRTGKTIPKPEGHPYLRLTRVVEAGHVFTIEPGFYFIESLLADLAKSDNSQYINWPKVDAFRKFGGIRIEDDIVVTETGHENLTRDAFNHVA
jgi:Xaa-Pro dipeptidase